MHFQSTSQTKTIIIRTMLACSQLCIHAAVCVCVCVWLDQYDQNKEARHREGPELSIDDLANFDHRKDPTAWGNRMRDNKNSKTMPQVSQEAGRSAEVGKGHLFATRPSVTREGRWTRVCRECTLPRSNPN